VGGRSTLDVREELEKVRELLEGGETDEARVRCETLFCGLPDGTTDADRADVLWLLADAQSAAARHDEAADAYEEVISLLERLGRRKDAAVAANNLAYHHGQAGRSERAIAWIEEALERYRRIGEQPLLLRAHVNVGWYRLERGEAESAESAFRTAVQEARTFGDAAELGTSLLWLGRALARGGRTDRALLAFTEAIGHLERAGSGLRDEAELEIAALRSVPGGAR
jgi:tetratricopeptide (TPR) repeat protein